MAKAVSRSKGSDVAQAGPSDSRIAVSAAEMNARGWKQRTKSSSWNDWSSRSGPKGISARSQPTCVQEWVGRP